VGEILFNISVAYHTKLTMSLSENLLKGKMAASVSQRRRYSKALTQMTQAKDNYKKGSYFQTVSRPETRDQRKKLIKQGD
jgi:hypothetical protein